MSIQPARISVFASVALLAEGVDRNNVTERKEHNNERVALLAEGVDRNVVLRFLLMQYTGSPSSRRAWIEINAGTLAAAQQARRPPRGGRG